MAWSLFRLTSFTQHLHLKFLHVFSPRLGSSSLLMLNNIPPSGCTTINLFIHLLRGILFAFKFWQLWIKLLQTSVSMLLCGQMISAPLGRFQGAHLLDHTVRSKFQFCKTVFQSGCNICTPHQQYMRVPIASCPHQHVRLSVFQILAILIGAQWYLIVI